MSMGVWKQVVGQLQHEKRDRLTEESEHQMARCFIRAPIVRNDA